jgi:hypothetical protein
MRTWNCIWNEIGIWEGMSMHTLSETVAGDLRELVDFHAGTSTPPPSRILPFGKGGAVLEWVQEKDPQRVLLELNGDSTMVLSVFPNVHELLGTYKVPSGFLSSSDILAEILTGKPKNSRTIWWEGIGLRSAMEGLSLILATCAAIGVLWLLILILSRLGYNP